MTRHAVLGAGGVGGLMAAYLARSGFPVCLVLRREVVRDYPAELELETPSGSFRVAVDRSASAPPADVLWVAVKAPQLESALTSVKDAEAIGAIVPLLNGVDHIQLLRSMFGAQRIVAATIAVESERVSPGHIAQRSKFVRLNLSSSGRGRLETCVERLRGEGVTCQFVDSEPALMWSKLVFLAPFALVTTAQGKSLGEIRSDPASWGRLRDAVLEACAVARAEGGNVDAEQVMSSIADLPEAMRSSMQKDVEAGKAPELDAIAGPIVRHAARHGLGVPVTRALMDVVEQRTRRGYSC